MARAFIVPGEPRGKMRPKASNFGGHSRVYTPSKQIEYENWIRCCYREKYPDEPIWDEPLAVAVVVYMGIPKSTPKKKRALMLQGDILPTKKPDLDNVIKDLDALNGIAFTDDSLITDINACKRYAETPRVEFFMKKIADTKAENNRGEQCEAR